MKTAMVGFRSVRRRLFAAMMGTALVALVVAAAALSFYDLHSHRANGAARLESDAALIGYSTSAALQFDDRAVAAQNLAFLEARPAVRVAAIYTARGTLFASYQRADAEPTELPPIPRTDAVSIEGDEVRLFRRIKVNGEVLGTVYMAEDLGLYERVASYAAIILSVMVAALAVAGGLSAWLQRGITRPIMDIAAVAREVVERRNYAVRATRTTRDEVGMLVDAVNEMLSEIERRTAEILRLNEDLERRVSERTAQLEDSNVQLREASVAKSNFLSMMSHEIRTPMNGVMGMLELLSLGALDAHQRSTLEVVRESGRSLLRIIDDILDFSKIEAGKLEVVMEVASVRAVVESVIGIYAGNASSKALVLRSRIDPRIRPAVRIDPLRLQQILNNLVSNAIKFTSKGSVEVAADLVDHAEGVDTVRFTVTDTGIGIAPHAMDKLFQPFSQGGAGVVRVFGGTGLGLSIGQRLAALMGGSVTISSRHGEGTSVALTLPMAIADVRELPGTQRDARRDNADVKKRRAGPDPAPAPPHGTFLVLVDHHPLNPLSL
jgi:signal transduction histidine kinase